MTLYPDRKDRIINLLNELSSYALALGATPQELRSWIELPITIREHRGQAEDPKHETRLRYIIEELCWFAPGVGIPLETVLGWVQNRILFRDEGLRIMSSPNPPQFVDVAPEVGHSDGCID